jgi:hypothetical protein
VSGIDRIKSWLGRAKRDAEAEVEGSEPIATPPEGSLGEPERETSTNAQMQGARDAPWPDNPR